MLPHVHRFLPVHNIESLEQLARTLTANHSLGVDTMEMKGERQLPAGRAAVWAMLNDTEVLKSCVPGCESMIASGEHAYDVVMNASIGPVKARFKGKMSLMRHRSTEWLQADVRRPEQSGGLRARRGEDRAARNFSAVDPAHVYGDGSDRRQAGANRRATDRCGRRSHCGQILRSAGSRDRRAHARRSVSMAWLQRAWDSGAGWRHSSDTCWPAAAEIVIDGCESIARPHGSYNQSELPDWRGLT